MDVNFKNENVYDDFAVKRVHFLDDYLQTDDKHDVKTNKYIESSILYNKDETSDTTFMYYFIFLIIIILVVGLILIYAVNSQKNIEDVAPEELTNGKIEQKPIKSNLNKSSIKTLNDFNPENLKVIY